MRITNGMIYRNFINNLFRINEHLAEDYEKIASGKRIKRPSDDPLGMARSIRYRSYLSTIRQYKRNIEMAISWQNLTESALKAVENALQRVQEIAISQASDTANANTRKNAAKEIENIKKHILGIVNTKFGNRYIFAGYITDNPPFSESDNNYHGDEGLIKIRINSATQLSFNIPGSVFAPADGINIFQMIDNLKDAMENNEPENIRACLDEIKQALDQVINAQASLGAKMNLFEEIKVQLVDMDLDFTGIISNTEDADLAKVTIDLGICQTVYQATLTATAKAIPINLFNYLG
ncbi:MAG: flagellar hook-associated protein FlgL [Deltaproteobacteria bacterium]|nr:flagellar hook-associated protein FlgL [Deltaproteobacteria bacterium]